MYENLLDYLSFIIKNMKEPNIKKILDVHYYIVRYIYSNVGSVLQYEKFIKTEYTELPCGKKVLDILKNNEISDILLYKNYSCLNNAMKNMILDIISKYENNELISHLNESVNNITEYSILDIAKDGNASKNIIEYITEWK